MLCYSKVMTFEASAYLIALHVAILTFTNLVMASMSLRIIKDLIVLKRISG